MRWRIEVVEESVSLFRWGGGKVCHCYICSLLIEVSISLPLYVYDYEYFDPWMQLYLIIHVGFIYSRVGLTLNIYHACLVRYFWGWIVGTSVVENLNGDLIQPSRIRYVSYPLVLAAFISLAYWNGLISGVIQSIVVYPKPWEISLCNNRS